MTHQLSHDTGLDRDGECLPGRDCRNNVIRCSCGWAYSGTYRDVEHRGATHVDVFERNDERRKWNDPRRATAMPYYAW